MPLQANQTEPQAGKFRVILNLGRYNLDRGESININHRNHVFANSKLPLTWTARNLSNIDYLPIEEHKVPMALTTEEALGEANIGCKLHSQYVRRYHELP
jgi:hypothetical protein